MNDPMKTIVAAAAALRKLPEGRHLAQLFRNTDVKDRDYLEMFFADALELAEKR
jgi:hypothetical protein